MLVGDPQAFAEGSRAQIEQVRGAVAQGRSHAESWWSGVVSGVRPVLDSGRAELAVYGELLQEEADDISARVEALRCGADTLSDPAGTWRVRTGSWRERTGSWRERTEVEAWSTLDAWLPPWRSESSADIDANQTSSEESDSADTEQ